MTRPSRFDAYVHEVTETVGVHRGDPPAACTSGLPYVVRPAPGAACVADVVRLAAGTAVVVERGEVEGLIATAKDVVVARRNGLEGYARQTPVELCQARARIDVAIEKLAKHLGFQAS